MKHNISKLQDMAKTRLEENLYQYMHIKKKKKHLKSII